METLIGQTLNNRYNILRLLGTGGMGTVYFAHDPVLDRNVAIKQLNVDPITGQLLAEQIHAQFLREAQLLASLHHPNLPRVTDYFSENQRHYLVMDYIEGQTLHELVQANPGGLEESQVLDWADQLLAALEYIHAHHLIHRDIKPSNIRRTPDGRIFLVDFGLAKPYDPDNPRTITMIHGVGTPEYSPPEQYDPQSHTDERSDLYALGATLYHLLTGVAPASVTRRISDPESLVAPRANNTHISPQVEAVIMRALELERVKRFASASDMRAALHLASQTHPMEPATGTIALPPIPHTSSAKKSRRKKFILLTGSAVAIVSVVMLTIFLTTTTPQSSTAPASSITPAEIKIALLSGSTSPEYVVIQNSGGSPQDLSGWYLESTRGTQVFNFPTGLTLQPGDSVRIESFTGAVNDPPKSLLWSTDAVWRNAGDKAVLRNQTGAAVSTQCYGDACP